MFIEDLKTRAPKVNFEYNINPEDHYTTCPCGKFVAYSYISCPACGKLIVRKAKPEVGELPVEPRKEVVFTKAPEAEPITEVVKEEKPAQEVVEESVDAFTAAQEPLEKPEVVAVENLFLNSKPKRGHRKE